MKWQVLIIIVGYPYKHMSLTISPKFQLWFPCKGDWKELILEISPKRSFKHCLIASSLTNETLSFKLICFGGDNVSVFQGATIGVTWQIQMDYVPHM